MKIYGKNVLNEAIRNNRKIDMVYIEEKTFQKETKWIEFLKDRKIKYQILNKQNMDKEFSGLHQGIGAIVEDYTYQLIEDCINKNKKQIFVILDGIEDPHNLGAMLRSCDAFSIDAVIIPKNRSVKLNETVVKVSTGAIEYVSLCEVNNLTQTILMLKKMGFWIIGTDAQTESELTDVNLDSSLAIVIGSEGFGISRLVKESCDYLVKIPMTGHINSLNASVSCGIILQMIRFLQK